VQGSVTTILSTPTLLMFTLKEFKKNFTETWLKTIEPWSELVFKQMDNLWSFPFDYANLSQDVSETLLLEAKWTKFCSSTYSLTKFNYTSKCLILKICHEEVFLCPEVLREANSEVTLHPQKKKKPDE
jgi:hypothetical protein